MDSTQSENIRSGDTQPDSMPPGGPPQFGITITKRIGNAVTRNLIRRRLKAALRDLAEIHARPGYDYVVIARQKILTRSFAQLTQELKTALERVHSPRSKKSRTGTARPRQKSRSTDQCRQSRKS